MRVHVAQHAAQSDDARLLVAWQNSETRLISPVGFLDYRDGLYHFRYLSRALEVDGFRPLLGFPNFYAHYESRQLFPIFAQRIMSARRSEYPDFLAELDLPLGSDPTPMEILGRSGGHRVGDTIQLLPVPSVSVDGSTSCEFLISGVRHRMIDDDQVANTLDALKPGDVLSLLEEPTNPVNGRALVALCEDGVTIGWVPDLLLDYVHALRDVGTDETVVAHVNGPGTPPHLRVLARITGQVGPDFRPFEGEAWQVIPGGSAITDDRVLVS